MASLSHQPYIPVRPTPLGKTIFFPVAILSNINTLADFEETLLKDTNCFLFVPAVISQLLGYWATNHKFEAQIQVPLGNERHYRRKKIELDY